jgi:hypothetical protein
MFRFLAHTQSNTHAHARTCTHWHVHTPVMSSLNEWSGRRIGRQVRNTLQTQETTIRALRFEPAIPTIKLFQTYALDRTATKNGNELS